MTRNEKRPRVMKTTVKSLEILEMIREEQPVRVTDVAEAFDMNRGSAYTHLATLKEFGYANEEDGKYWLGAPLIRLGQTAKTQCPVLQAASSIVSEVANETNERTQFFMEEQGKLWYISGDSGNRGIDTGVDVGTAVPIHATASGKAVLANVTPEKREEMIQDIGFEEYNSNTITDYDALMEEVETVRDRGFAISQQEITDYLNSVAVPITSSEASSVGALCIIGPAQYLKPEYMKNELVDELMAYANKLEVDVMRETEGTVSPYNSRT